jgi:EF hand
MSKKRFMMLATVVLGLAAARGLVFAAPHLDPAIKQTVQLLVLMETDPSGKVTKAEFMKFMEAQFDRLDKNKDGALDVKEFTQSSYYVHTGARR